MTIAGMLFSTFPAVRKQLGAYIKILRRVDSPLTEQGLASIRDKEFHCLGGSVYALLAQGEQRWDVLRFIVAFQTISDYLDNLCDRFGLHSEQVFRRLHTAMLDSLEPDSGQFHDYYSLFPCRDDGGYLPLLVGDCRSALRNIPGYSNCKAQAQELTRLYIDLQSYKHMERKIAEEKLSAHCESHRNLAPGLRWWEFAAACGSTLGVFTLAAYGRDPDKLYSAYMPWVNGLHILLDYYIDQDEDVRHDDMNLVSYFHKQEETVQRLLWFYRRARLAVKDLERSRLHALVIDGLLGMYLSDPKARSEVLAGTTGKILAGTDFRARFLERMAWALRRAGVL